MNFNDGLGDGLEPGLEAYFSLEGVPEQIAPTIVQQAPPANLEPGLAGVTVYLDLNHTGQLEPNDPETQTDALGHYFFSNLAPGTYTVAEVTQSGLVQTGPPNGTYTAVVKSGQVTSGLDFGNAVVTNAAPRPPKITSTAPATAAAGQTYRYEVIVSNPDDDVLSFDLPVKPDGMVVDALTGTIDWEPTDSQLGPQNVVLRLTDNKGDVVLQSFTVQVDEESPPVITSTPPTQPAQSGLPYQYQVEAQDAQNDPLTYSLLQAPSGMTIDPNSGLLSWVGAQIGPGLPAGYSVTIQVANPFGGTATQSYTVLVISPGFDRPPVITSHPDTHHTFDKEMYYQVVASDPDGDPLAYSLPVAPAGMTISSTGLVSWSPTQNQLGANPVTVQVDDGRGLHATQSFTINVAWQSPSAGIQITSVPPATARAGVEYDYNPTATEDLDGLVVGVSAIWTLGSAPAGMSINPRTATVSWTPTMDQLGSATVVLRATSIDGAGSSTQEFTITVVSGDIPPSILSTPSTQGIVGELYTYAVQAKDAQGNPLTYSLLTAPSGMVINPSTGLVQWAPTADQIGSHSVVIDVSDGQGGGAVQGYNIVVSSTAASQPPTITSTPGLLAAVSQPYTYQATATDPQGESLTFSLLNAPTGMTIDPASGLIQWTPDPTQLETNPVLLAVTNTDGEIATQNFAITVQPPNQPPVIMSSPVTTVTAGAPYEYDVMSVDPDGDSLTYTLTTAPTGMTIDSLGRITWSPQIADIGNPSVHVSVSDGRGSTVSQSFTIAVTADTEAPQVLLSLNANPVNMGTPDMAVISATDNVGVTALTLTLNGVPVPIDSQGQATLPDATAGVFTLGATASDAAGNVGTATQALTVINPQVTNAPIVAITTPADNGMVTAPTQVIGTVQDPNLVSYTLSVAPIGSQNFTTISTGTSQVNNGVLGTFDPTMLQDGSYDLRLIATNTGGLNSEADVTVDVSGILKLGNFSVSFTDLTVPVAGIPITVTRTYDSLTANQSGDFGYGWRLEFRDTQLQTSVPATGDEADDLFNPFQFGSHVYITLPGSPREGFTFEPTPAPGLLGGFLGVLEPTFVPDPGVKDTLTVPSADLTVAADGSLEDYSTGLPYNPASPIFGNLYTLTTSQGLVYSINASTGEIDSVTNSNNDTLTFSDAGVTSSSGTSISFQRDAQGRIAAIVDPAGEKLLYQYDVNGNLVGVTDRSNNTTQFVYLSTPAHYLSKVIDPLGRTGIRTDYDANGRLDELIDANGNPVQLDYAPSASTETITDQLGNPTTYEYDAQGNIIEQIDALGGVTRRTFDANNDMLTQTDPMGRTTSFTYDARGDVLTKTDGLGNATFSAFKTITFGTTNLFGIQTSAPFSVLEASTDPLGNTTSFAVGAAGNYTSMTDPLGNIVSQTTDPSGNPVSVSYPDGSTVQYTYDSNGELLSTTDSLGNQTTYTYDADGNRLTSTTTVTAADGSVKTLTTTTTYDAQGREIAVTDPDGNVTRTEYDANGNKIAAIDPLGNRTQYVYDADNRLIKTIYADGSTTQSEYDADGHVTATTDQLGRVTQYQYDALGRVIKTIYPDGSSTETKYDADGEVIAATDQLGNTTTYQYDADGNQIAQTDPLGHSSTNTYNANGQLVTEKDPLGQTTKLAYNANGELVETDYPDGTKSTTTYDSQGRVLSKTDQLGQKTSYQYDTDGHLIAVTDPLGNKTTYMYDQMGRQVAAATTQTAADGSVRTLTTKTEYDDLGRVIAVIDPVGNLTQTEYDADGNVTATTDPLGRVTRYVYNSLNRLIETIYPDKTTTQIEYDAAGERTATIDELGRKTEYEYDSLGRLTKTIYPDGSSTQTQYDADGHVIAQINELGNRTAFQYDADGRETLATDALGDTSSNTYDADGRKTSVTDALGHTTQYVYDALGRPIEADYVDGTKTTNTYDADGRLIATTDQLGRTTRYQYDANGRQTTVIDPLGQTTQYANDEAGQVIRKTDANGNVTTYEYDGDGRQIAILLPALPGQAAFESTTQYDADGNVIATTDDDGNTIQYAYDARNRLITKAYPDGTSVAYTYTLTGQVATVTDSRGTMVNSYDQRDRLLSSTEPDGTIISYTYDSAGDCTTVTTPAGTTSYTFDALGHELTVTDPNGEVTTYTYDAAGNLIRTILPNGIVETRSYDDLNRLTFLQDVSNSTVVASYTYTLGLTGLIEKVIENWGRTVEYTYDALDRLTQEKIIDPASGDRTINYTYDAVGNRLTMNDSVAGLTIYTYDAMDRLTTSTLAGQATSYTYDKNGNLLTEVSPTQALFSQYDFNNRLIAAGANGVTNETNEYDAGGNLVSQAINGQETRYLVDTVHTYAQIVMEYSPGGTITAAYVYGNGLISQTRGGVQSVYLVDALGSTRELSNAAGSVTDQYTYDAFGRILFQSGATMNPYLFAGQRTDPITGLDYMRARYYDPAVGRFTSADPLRQVTAHNSSFQFYVYAQNDPVNRIDPSGLEDIADFEIASACDSVITSAVIGAGIGGTLGFIRGGVSGGLQGLIGGFVSGLLLGGALATGAALAEAVGGSVAATSFSITTTTVLTGYGVYNAGKDLYNAKSGTDVGAGFFELMTSLIGGFFGIKGGRGASAKGGATPEIQQDIQVEADATGEPIDQLGAGPTELESNYLVGPDPVTGQKMLVLDENTFPNLSSNGLQALDPATAEIVSTLQPADTVVIRVNAPDISGQTEADLGRQAFTAQRTFAQELPHVDNIVIQITYQGTVYEYPFSDTQPVEPPPPPEPPGG